MHSNGRGNPISLRSNVHPLRPTSKSEDYLLQGCAGLTCFLVTTCNETSLIVPGPREQYQTTVLRYERMPPQLLSKQKNTVNLGLLRARMGLQNEGKKEESSQP